jgi:hypothetical protein
MTAGEFGVEEYWLKRYHTNGAVARDERASCRLVSIVPVLGVYAGSNCSSLKRWNRLKATQAGRTLFVPGMKDVMLLLHYSFAFTLYLPLVD